MAAGAGYGGAGLRACAALLVAGLLVACRNGAAEAATADGWVRECPGDAFCFSRPPGLQKQPGQPIDTLTADYRGGGLSLTFDLGRQGTSVDHLVQPRVEVVTVNERAGRVLSSDKEVVLLVPKVHTSGPFTIQFSMTLKSDTAVPRDTAQRIFQSIEFKPPR